jgi:hypothetical protein
MIWPFKKKAPSDLDIFKSFARATLSFACWHGALGACHRRYKPVSYTGTHPFSLAPRKTSPREPTVPRNASSATALHRLASVVGTTSLPYVRSAPTYVLRGTISLVT